MLRLFNTGCSNSGKRREGIYAISGIEALSGDLKQFAGNRCKACEQSECGFQISYLQVVILHRDFPVGQ